jgi:DNA polymerase III gamma/tau subunit
MPSAPDENQRSEPLKDILGLTSANPAGSIVDSIQSLRNLAHQLTLAEITESEKKVKQIVSELSDLQQTLKKLKKLRLHVHPVSPENRPEAKPKNLSKPSTANVIPFPHVVRGSEASATSEASPTVNRPVADAQGKSEGRSSASPGSHSGSTKPDLQTLREQLSAARPVKLPENTGREKEESLPSGEKSAAAVDARSEREPEIPVHIENSAAEITSTPNEAEPVIPEVVIVNEQAQAARENVALPSKRMAVDQEIKELVKTYGQVDIYTHRESDGRQNLRKAALAGVLLIVVLAVSYFFFH